MQRPSMVAILDRGKESIAVQALRQGAENYLFVDQITPEMLDITVRKAIENSQTKRDLTQTRQALHDQQRFLHQLTEAVPGILYIYDLVERRNVFINRQITDVLGYTPEQVQALGSDVLLKLLHPDDLDRVPQHLAQFETAPDHQVFELEYRMRTAQGEWHWFHTQEVVFRRSTKGIPDQILGLSQEIMQRKTLELSLTRSNQRFELAIDAIQSLVYDLDLLTGRVERTRGLVNVVGYLPEEAEPTVAWWHDRIHPEDLAAFEQIDFVERLRHEDRFESEYRVRHRDGHYIWVQERSVVVRDDQHRAIRLVGNTNDINDRRSAEQALRESEAKFRRLSDSNLIGIFFADFSGRIYEANEAFLNLLGYTREELNAGALNWISLTPPGYEAHAQIIEAQLKATGIAPPAEKEYYHKDGSRVPILIGTAMMEGHEQDGYSICFGLDLRDRKRAAQERDRLLAEAEAARAEAEAANRSKDEFLAMVSHELRSPLNSILGWAKLLQARTFDAETLKRALSVIERNALLQSQLIEDLLDVSRMIRGNLRINLAPVNLAVIVETAIANIQLAAEAKGVALRSQIEQSLNPVMGDSHRLQQVITNLLTNAVKFTPSGGSVDVTLLIKDSSAVEIIVRDTGKGIDPAFLPRVFDRFAQADTDSNRSKDGLGLGLAISRHLVELHNGTIRAESAGVDRGATFTVRLPT
ncbi:PAS domain-containing protein [Leptolyngbya sp. NIES-2104]|uniref:PAS domain-containing protein n=1 Tax=Leptolyngbya sp. NIES-2104 TaxID=1552121 RepID=UPI00178CC32B|nr:PAS domain-containing protein [Leptolyngbya sp. NIES-2104]